METVIILKEVAKILLFGGAFGLCIIVAIGLVKLFPHLRRLVGNLAAAAEAASKIGGDLAAASADVAGDVRKAAASTAEGAEHFAETGRNVMEFSGTLQTAIRVVQTLVAAYGGMANIVERGISRMPGMVRDAFRRGRPNS